MVNLLNLYDLDSKKIMEEIKREQENENHNPLHEEEKTLEAHEMNEELKKLEKYLQGSPTGEAVGSHRRLVLTRTAADLCLIMFCIFDIPFRKPIYGFKKLKYFSWLLQCILVIVYQLVELNYVQRDIKYLRNYLNNKGIEKDLKLRITTRLKELRKNYIIRM